MIFCLLTIILIGRLNGELSGALYSPDDLQLLCGEGEGGGGHGGGDEGGGGTGGGGAGLWVGDALPDAVHLRHQHPHHHRSVSGYHIITSTGFDSPT